MKLLILCLLLCGSYAAPGGRMMKVNEDGSYLFSFDNGDEGPRHSREEFRNADGTIVGQYSFEDGAGAVRVVQYRAGKDGFVASGNVGVDPEENIQIPLPGQGTLEGQEEAKVIPQEPIEETKEPIFEANPPEDPPQDEYQQSASETREKAVQQDAPSEEGQIDPTFPLVVTQKRRLTDPQDSGIPVPSRPSSSIPAVAFTSSHFIPSPWYGIPRQYYYYVTPLHAPSKDKAADEATDTKKDEATQPAKSDAVHLPGDKVYVVGPQAPAYDPSYKTSGVHYSPYPIYPGPFYYYPSTYPAGVHALGGAHVSTIVHHHPGKSGYSYYYGY